MFPHTIIMALSCRYKTCRLDTNIKEDSVVVCITIIWVQYLQTSEGIQHRRFYHYHVPLEPWSCRLCSGQNQD
ncbi:unnamed protein product [Arabidopsis halleri]